MYSESQSVVRRHFIRREFNKHASRGKDHRDSRFPMKRKARNTLNLAHYEFFGFGFTASQAAQIVDIGFTWILKSLQFGADGWKVIQHYLNLLSCLK